MARWAARSSNDAPLDCVTCTSARLPSARMVKVTATGWLKPDLICWFQIVQIFCCTPARYQSPPESVPSGTPGPEGPRARPGVAEAVDFASEPAAGARGGSGVAVFLRALRGSSSGTALVDGRGSSLGGFRTFGGSTAGAGASVFGSGAA